MERLRFGVLSTADIGMEKVTPAIAAADNCDVIAIASRDGDRAQEAARKLGIPRAYGSYAGLLDDPDVDAVYIPLPNHLHAEWTIAAANAGKHVLCEKPLAMNAAEARRVVEACTDAGVVMMEAFMYRLHPTWIHAKQLVDRSVIGDLVAVQSWFSYFNDDPDNIRNIAEYGGGALMDIGCYNINLSRMLFGAEPTSVQATMRRDPKSGVDIATSGVLGFGEGQATFTCTTQAEPDQRVHIVGTRGRIDIEIPFNIPPDLPTKVMLTAGGNPPVDPDTEVLTFEPRDAYTAQAEAFATAILDGTPVPVSNEDSIANMAVIDAVVAAAG
ncbi:MAG TPA: Gfo/Idh/MocA family oxidoreductase [Acidimicrobiia bacterium]|nr:Gfo/Idh/MocA family oxidoreductase [Acidimicrobiia bacterium]